ATSKQRRRRSASPRRGARHRAVCSRCRRHTPCSSPRLHMSEAAQIGSRYPPEMEALALAPPGTPDGAAILDPLGRISFVNRALVVALERPEPELVGRLLEEFMCVLGGDPALGDVVAAVGERGRWSGMLRLAGSEGARGVWEVTLTPLALGTAPGSLPG